MQTTYSVLAYGFSFDSDTIHDGNWTGSATDEELAKLIDSDLLVNMAFNTSLDTCYYQVQYADGLEGYMDRFEYYMY